MYHVSYSVAQFSKFSDNSDEYHYESIKSFQMRYVFIYFTPSSLPGRGGIVKIYPHLEPWIPATFGLDLH